MPCGSSDGACLLELKGEEETSRSERRWIVAEQDASTRLDVHVALRLAISRNQARQWIESESVLVDGHAARPSRRVRAGHEISCEPPPLPDERPFPEAGPLAVLYADADLIAVNKAAGVVVHPGAGRELGTLTSFLLHRYPEIANVGSPLRPGIVHRLDIGTTGVLVVARTDQAYAGLSAAFAERRVQKTYLAIVYGAPRGPEGTIDKPIVRHPRERRKMTVSPRGREAVTHYRVLASSDGLSLLSVVIETGRTHQIRVHLKSENLPIVGDPLYGEARWKGHLPRRRSRLQSFERPALHAHTVDLQHPTTSEALRLEAPIPEDLRDLWHGLFEGALASAMPESVGSAEDGG